MPYATTPSNTELKGKEVKPMVFPIIVYFLTEFQTGRKTTCL